MTSVCGLHVNFKPMQMLIHTTVLPLTTFGPNVETVKSAVISTYNPVEEQQLREELNVRSFGVLIIENEIKGKRGTTLQCRDLPVAVSARRSLRCSCLPVISTAETRTENRAPVCSFWSLISRNNQSMAHGMTPRDVGESSTPSIVYVLPA